MQIYLKCMKKFVQKKWKIDVINLSKSEAGGYKEIIFSVTGDNIYSYLKYESGVHRVQRVPDTETQGRYTLQQPQLPYFQKQRTLILK